MSPVPSRKAGPAGVLDLTRAEWEDLDLISHLHRVVTTGILFRRHPDWLTADGFTCKAAGIKLGRRAKGCLIRVLMDADKALCDAAAQLLDDHPRTSDIKGDLLDAAVSHGIEKLVRGLFRAGAKPVVRALTLQFAAGQGRWALIRLLIERGVKVPAEAQGEVALYAALQGKFDVLKTLVDQGADLCRLRGDEDRSVTTLAELVIEEIEVSYPVPLREVLQGVLAAEPLQLCELGRNGRTLAHDLALRADDLDVNTLKTTLAYLLRLRVSLTALDRHGRSVCDILRKGLQDGSLETRKVVPFLRAGADFAGTPRRGESLLAFADGKAKDPAVKEIYAPLLKVMQDELHKRGAARAASLPPPATTAARRRAAPGL